MKLVDKPIVSIIMPVYNDKENVIESIKSVKDQTKYQWELIIVDDCSRDGTRCVYGYYYKE